MSQEIKISLLDKVKRPNTGSKLLDQLLEILTIPLYPVLLLFGLLFMFFAGLISIWQRLTISKEDLQKQKQEISDIEIRNEQWRIFTSADNVVIEQQLAGSLPWNSGDYLYLKCNPIISYLTGKYFGDWLFADFGGVFLQKWNDTRNINCDLIFIDFDTLKVTELKTGLPTKHWTTEKLNQNEIKFIFTTADTDLVYIVKRTEAIQNESI